MHVILAYKNFAASRGISHIGLGVTALNTAKYLRAAGIRADVWPITSVGDLHDRLNGSDATHVIISAPWIETLDLAALCSQYTDIQFSVVCHSNLGFLQADPNAMKLVIEGMDLQRSSFNFSMAANCQALADWLTALYGAQATCIPNIYYVDNPAPTPQQYNGGTLRCGIFGATRALKNMQTSGGAALAIAAQMKAPVEIWISSGRNEGAGSVVSALQQMVAPVPGAKIVENGWQTWPQFRQTVGHMHLLFQLSYTESFNVVTADGICAGVPSVVSPAIDWVPDRWKADPDDAMDAAFVGRALLSDPLAARDGMRALQIHNALGMDLWKSFLKVQ